MDQLPDALQADFARLEAEDEQERVDHIGLDSRPAGLPGILKEI